MQLDECKIKLLCPFAVCPATAAPLLLLLAPPPPPAAAAAAAAAAAVGATV